MSSRTLFGSGDGIWATLMPLFNAMKTDARLSTQTKAQLASDYAVALAAAGTSGMPPDVRGRFLHWLEFLLNCKQA